MEEGGIERVELDIGLVAAHFYVNLAYCIDLKESIAASDTLFPLALQVQRLHPLQSGFPLPRGLGLFWLGDNHY